MQLEQIRDKAYSDAIRRVPNPSFGASIHEYGETEQEVLKSAGAAVSVVSGDAWSMDVRFGDMVYRLRLSGVVKLESRESEANKNLETGQITQTDYMRIMKSISLKRESLEAMICDSFKRVYADLVQQCTHAEDLKLLVESRMIFVR